MKREGIKAVVATVRDAEARMRERDKRTAKAAKRFTLGEPVDVPLLAMRIVLGDVRIRHHQPTGHMVITKVDRKSGMITLEAKGPIMVPMSREELLKMYPHRGGKR